MEAAHNDEHVLTVVHHYLAAPCPELTALLIEALWAQWHPGPAAVQRLMDSHPVPSDYEEDCRFMTDAALRVAVGEGGKDPMRCRGAVLEQITERLCQRRADRVLTEVHCSPLPRQWNSRSRPLDVVVDEEPLEVMECKTGLMDFHEDDIELFEQITGLAESEGRSFMPALVSFQGPEATRRHVELLGPNCSMWVVSRADLHLLQDQAASEKAA